MGSPKIFRNLRLKFDTQLENEYAQKRFEEGRNGFAVVLWVMVIINPPYMLVEFFRSSDPLKPILFRSILEVLVLVVLLLNYRLKKIDHREYPYFYAISMLIFYLFMIAWQYYLPSGFYALFLPNITIIYFFINASFTGMRFNQSTTINLLLIGTYAIYAYLFSQEPYHVRQIPALVSILIIGMLVSYLIERFNRKLFLNHQIIKEKSDTIEQMNQELKDRHELKNSLISVLSHDVNSPLNSIKSLIQLYREKDLPREDMLQYWKHIDNSVDRVLGFTRETIHWIKQQMDSFEPNVQSLELKSIIADTIELCNTQAQLKNVQLTCNIDRVQVESDEEILKIALRNLLSNAIKYSYEGGKIEIMGATTGKVYRLSVKDSGKGIPEERKSLLFSKHINEPGTRNEQGSGLGLSFSNMLMQQLGGSIEVKSRVDEGSCFTLVFPHMG